jgi:putative PIN family toxin of toxin-antitoxin system
VTRRVVFDTNAVVSALLFENGRLAWLRGAWAGGQLVPVVCTETVAELLRVLAYPKFQLQRDEINHLLGDFLPYAEIATLEDAPLPDCDDPDDRVFLALALQATADALVTGDGKLLALGRSFPVPILTPAELKKSLS